MNTLIMIHNFIQHQFTSIQNPLIPKPSTIEK